MSDLERRYVPKDKTIVLNSIKSLAEKVLKYNQYERHDETTDSRDLKSIQSDVIDKVV